MSISLQKALKSAIEVLVIQRFKEKFTKNVRTLILIKTHLNLFLLWSTKGEIL